MLKQVQHDSNKRFAASPFLQAPVCALVPAMHLCAPLLPKPRQTARNRRFGRNQATPMAGVNFVKRAPVLGGGESA
jgi:hypothetical protein